MNAERSARRIAAGAALVLLAIVTIVLLAGRDPAGITPLSWQSIAPPPEIAVRPWHALAVSRRGVGEAHFAIIPAPGGPVHVETLGAWRVQRQVGGAPADTLVVALGGRTVGEAEEEALAALAAVLVRNLPSLPIRGIGADRFAPPDGLDVDRLRFRVRNAAP